MRVTSGTGARGNGEDLPRFLERELDVLRIACRGEGLPERLAGGYGQVWKEPERGVAELPSESEQNRGRR